MLDSESSLRLSLPSRKRLCNLKLALFILAAIILPSACVGVISNLTQNFFVDGTSFHDNARRHNLAELLMDVFNTMAMYNIKKRK